MNLLPILLVLVGVAVVCKLMMRANSKERIFLPAAQACEMLPPWVEILASNDEIMAVGRRLAWLPAEFGPGASALVGVIDLSVTVPELRDAIKRQCEGIYLDENLVLARMIARPSRDANLVMGALNDDSLRQRIDAAMPESIDAIGVLLELCSEYVGLMDTDAAKREFSDIWSGAVVT